MSLTIRSARKLAMRGAMHLDQSQATLQSARIQRVTPLGIDGRQLVIARAKQHPISDMTMWPKQVPSHLVTTHFSDSFETYIQILS